MRAPDAVRRHADNLRQFLSNAKNNEPSAEETRLAIDSALRVYGAGWVLNAEGSAAEAVRFDPDAAAKRFDGMGERALSLGFLDEVALQSLREALRGSGFANTAEPPARGQEDRSLGRILIAAAAVLKRHATGCHLQDDVELDKVAGELTHLLIDDAGIDGITCLPVDKQVEMSAFALSILTRAERHARTKARKLHSVQNWMDLFAARAELRDATLMAKPKISALQMIIETEARLIHQMRGPRGVAASFSPSSPLIRRIAGAIDELCDDDVILLHDRLAQDHILKADGSASLLAGSLRRIVGKDLNRVDLSLALGKDDESEHESTGGGQAGTSSATDLKDKSAAKRGSGSKTRAKDQRADKSKTGGRFNSSIAALVDPFGLIKSRSG